MAAQNNPPKKMKLSILALCLLAVSASAASWSNPFGGMGLAGAIVGCGVGDASTTFCAAGANGIGAEVLKTSDAGATFNRAGNVTGMMMLDAGALDASRAVVNGLFAAQYTTDGGATWKPSTGGGGQGQSCEGFGTASFGIAGGCGGKNGIAVSTDGGKTFTAYDSGLNSTAGYSARYGAYPSDKVWYVTAGSWPSQARDRAASADGSSHFLSERVKIERDESSGAFHMTVVDLPPRANGDGYAAAIAKTEDGGATWKTLFTNQGTFYFNGIHCTSENHCIAAGEAHGGSAPGGHIYETTDGETWSEIKKDSDAGAGMMMTRMLSDTEMWSAGAAGSEARFWHTTDGGKTWDKETVAGGAPMNLDFTDDGTKAFAAGVTTLQQSTVFEYK